MRFLADENVHAAVVRQLRAAAYEVEWIAQTEPGCSDAKILARSDIKELVLITYDRDFGDLIFNQGLPAPKAVIFCRLGRAEPRYLAQRIFTLIADGVADDHIHVLTRDGTRSTPFPAGV